MNTCDIVWQKTHSSTPDNIRNHPALKGLDLPRTGGPGRTFIGVLMTKNLVILAYALRGGILDLFLTTLRSVIVSTTDLYMLR